jgi:hypothetical protein
MIGESIGEMVDSNPAKQTDQPKGYIAGSSAPGSSVFKPEATGGSSTPGQYTGPSTRSAANYKPKAAATSGAGAPLKVSSSPVDSGNMSTPTMTDTKEGGLASVDQNSTMPNDQMVDSHALDTKPNDSLVQNISMVTEESMQEDSVEINPAIMMGDEGIQKSSPNVGPATTMSSLGLSDVPNPNYLGSALSILSEMYA